MVHISQLAKRNITCPLEEKENKTMKGSGTYLEKQVALTHLNELCFPSTINLLLKEPLNVIFLPKYVFKSPFLLAA